MELGATVCTPRAPSCLTCPVVDLCATRGERPAAAKAPRQIKRNIHYALNCREDSVFLIQRAIDASLMAGMWELPEIAAPPDQAKAALTVRHSITVTDYTVHIWRSPYNGNATGYWISSERLPRIALTGLARKILRKSGILSAQQLQK